MRHREKTYSYKSGDGKTKVRNIYGRDEKYALFGRTEISEPYEIHRICCRITLKMSEIRYVGVKWIDLAKYRFYCRIL